MRWLIALVPLICCAQTLPLNWAAGGAGFDGHKMSTWASYASLLTTRGEVYSFTTHEIFLSQTRPRIIQSSIRTGFAIVMRQIGPLTFLGFGDAGATAGGSGSVGGAFSGGGIATLKLGSTNWTLAFTARALQTTTVGTQVVWKFGMGREF